ncbi:MAG: YncE family protein [Arachidicoccus sp.]|nr:YncE family protein [Arachidicoccus sp.]
MKHYKLLWTLTASIFLASCSKNDSAPTQTAIQPANGFFILNQGGYPDNNSSLTYYDFTTNSVSNDLYQAANSKQLGNLAQDFIIYGSKIYITLNGGTSAVNTLAVLDVNTQKLLKSDTINVPRYIVSYNGKIFVSSWDNNVYEIDTATYSVDKKIPVSGVGPEGMAIVGSSLYVANSGGYGTDSTVSVIDLNSLTEIKKIQVGYGASRVVANANGDVYVTCQGNYTDTSLSHVAVIDSKQNALKTTVNVLASQIDIYNNNAFISAIIYDANYNSAIAYPEIDLSGNTIIKQNFITDGTKITYPYGIDVDAQNGNIYVDDASTFSQNGSIYCFTEDGALKFKTSSNGIGPCKIVFVRS